MDKAQAINTFWNSFGISAYDESTVPMGDDAPQFPYITYNVFMDSLGNVVTLNASLWDKGYSWERISKKAKQIAKAIGENGFITIPIDGGYLWITKGTPFAQRMTDPDELIRRIYLTLNVEFLTAY